MKKYDFLVLGSGSGLDVAVGVAEQYGWKVAVVEKGPMGGTCLNRGCIPSKIIIHSANVAETIARSKIFGIDAKVNSVDFTAVTKRASEFVDHDAAKIEKTLRDSPNVDLYREKSEFRGPQTLKVGGEEISARKILIAAGTRPTIPSIEGLDKVEYLTSDEALRLEKQPKSMIIIGGGYISCELGHFFGALGTKITIVQRSDLLINREDIDVATQFTGLFSQKYNVLLNRSVKKVEQKKDGTKVVTLKDNAGKTEVVEGDVLLIATGRSPNTDLIKTENTQVQLNEQKFVKVNEFMETTQEDTWALGDVVGKGPFKHMANWEALHIFWNLEGKGKYAVDYSILPHAIFTSPQIAGVGLTEQEAKEKNINYEVKKRKYEQTAMGKAIEDHEGFVKFIIDPKEEKILGCHIMGTDASTLIHEVIVAMKAAGGKISALRSSIHIHPALSEVVQRALW